MTIDEIFKYVQVFRTNEEQEILERINDPLPLSSFNERERRVIENLTFKSLVSKIDRENQTYVVKNVQNKTNR